MPVPRTDALFDRPRALGIGGEQFIVVVCFQIQAVHALQVLGDAVRDVAGIADESETFFRAAQDVADGIDGIVEDGKTLHGEIADGEGLPGFEGMPGRLDAGFPQHVSGGAGGVERDAALLQQGFQAAHVIAVFVGEQDRINGIRSQRLRAREQLLGAQAGIDENSGVSGGGEGGIATAAAAKNCELHGGTMPEVGGIGQVLP